MAIACSKAFTPVHFEGDVLHVTIDGQAKTFNLREISPTLLHASEQERQTFEISPSGYGIHWPSLDEDLSKDDKKSEWIWHTEGGAPVSRIPAPEGQP